MKSGKGFESTGGAYKSQALNDDSVKTAETHCRNVEVR